MKTVKAALVLSALLTSCDRPPAPPVERRHEEEQLAALRDQSRVLLVFAPSAADPRYLTQQRITEEARAGFTERDLVTVVVLGDAPALDRRYAIASGTFAVLLIGKDGHTAYRSTEPLQAVELFAKIDAMPMRQAEMRERGGSPAR